MNFTLDLSLYSARYIHSFIILTPATFTFAFHDSIAISCVYGNEHSTNNHKTSKNVFVSVS